MRRLLEWLRPPAPLIHNPHEPVDYPLGRWNLYIGGARRAVPGYVNLDLLGVPGVDVVADAARLPFRDGQFTRVECDAVLEHVPDPRRIMAEIERVLEPGGYAHVVAPFCHPFHEYPRDYQRFTLDGLGELRGGLDLLAAGWRTGPAATWLIITIEFVKLWLPWRWWRIVAHFTLGWTLFWIRYLDQWLLRNPEARRIGNHGYAWYRKPGCRKPPIAAAPAPVRLP